MKCPASTGVIRLIEVVRVAKEYPNKTVLRNVSFVLEPGVTTGLLGPNGSGKTTVMRMIAALIQPTSGYVSVDGVHAQDRPQEVRRKMGVLFGGDASLYNRLTARENALYFARLQGLTKSRAHEDYSELQK